MNLLVQAVTSEVIHLSIVHSWDLESRECWTQCSLNHGMFRLVFFNSFWHLWHCLNAPDWVSLKKERGSSGAEPLQDVDRMLNCEGLASYDLKNLIHTMCVATHWAIVLKWKFPMIFLLQTIDRRHNFDGKNISHSFWYNDSLLR